MDINSPRSQGTHQKEMNNMLGLDNPIHLAFLLMLLLLVFGAKRLPEMGRSLGSGMRGFKDSLSADAQPTLSATTAQDSTAHAAEHVPSAAAATTTTTDAGAPGA